MQSDLPKVVSRGAMVVAAALLVSLVARSVVSWKYWGDLDHNSPGTWLCMADDAREGLLYRPLVSELGYGGTRYAPIFAVIIAGFLKVGIGPVNSGFLAGLIAAGATVSGLYALLRQMKVSLPIAGSMAIFVLAATCARTNILAIKCDLLPLGFSLWGLAAAVWSSEHAKWSRGLAIAAVCFALAQATKITSIFGLVTAMTWLLFHNKSKQSAGLGLMWLAGLCIVVLITLWASDGRAATIFRESSTGGGGFVRLLKGPHLMISAIVHFDRTLLGIWILAVFAIAVTGQWISLPSILLLLSTVGTMLIYGSPGTHMNHLVDMDAAALIVIATVSLKTRVLQPSILAVTTLLMIFGAAACWRQMSEMRQIDERGQIAGALADADQSTGDGPILAENPMLPMLVGQRPYMLDPFTFRAVRAKKPAIADQLWQDLDSQHFKAVILHNPLDDPQYSSDEYDFGPGFIERLKQKYVLMSVRENRYFVLLPK